MEAEASSVPTCDIEHEDSDLDEYENTDLNEVAEPAGPPQIPPKNSRLFWFYKDVCRELDGIVTWDSITPSSVPVSTEDGFKVLCSYNWIHKREPTIIAPGGAPKFARHALPVKLEPDSGVVYCDLNVANTPRHPFSAVFTALSVMSPPAKLDKIDVIISRSALVTLFKFAGGGYANSFRLQMNMVQKTLIVTHKERRNKRFVGLSGQVPSWGYAFEEGFTTYEQKLKESISHHRVVTYRFGSLKVAVLHEVDASYSASSGKHPPGPAVAAASLPEVLQKRNGNSSMYDMDRSLPEVGIEVRRAGRGTAPEDVAELKAKRIDEAGTLDGVNIDVNTKAQCWFGRIPHVIRGLHMDGVFHDISVVKFDFKSWAKTNQQRLRTTVSLLETLRERTRSMGGCGVAILNSTKSKTRLEIWKPNRITNTSLRPVPFDIIKRHWSPVMKVGRFRM